MANIVNRRFRKPDSYKTLHERFGDAAISAPTDGSWNQFENPHQSSQKNSAYGPGFVPEYPRRTSHSNDRTIAEPPSSSRHSSFSMSTLNPRRLSMRLAPKPKTNSQTQHDDQLLDDRRNEFAYKPIHQDYPTEVASVSGQPSPRFRYIPATTTPRYIEDTSRYSTSSRASLQTSDRKRQTVSSRTDVLDEEDHDEQYARSVRSGYRSSSDYSQRASSIFGGRGAGSSSERRNRRSTRYMTTTMVPDEDDIYG